jgi:hypothetical protein
VESETIQPIDERTYSFVGSKNHSSPLGLLQAVGCSSYMEDYHHGSAGFCPQVTRVATDRVRPIPSSWRSGLRQAIAQGFDESVDLVA